MGAKKNIWSPAELAILLEHYQTAGPDYVAEQTGRPVHLVRAKAWKLNLTSTGAEEWSEKELELLRRHYPVGGADLVVELTGRPRKAVASKAKRLRIKSGKPPGAKRWTPAEDALLQAEYPTGSLSELMVKLGRNLDAIRSRAAKFKLNRLTAAPRPASVPKASQPKPAPAPKPAPVTKVKPAPKPKKPVLSEEEKALKKLVRQKAQAKKEKKHKPEPAKKGWQYPMHSPEYKAWLASTVAGKQRETILDENGRTATVWRKAA
ncbi:hypothetical protein [Hymenobacter pini]|uniref:hypothetical protein n=1 Tax=Hymenobacter pini TaxID=2880879 RepID=UPI0021D3FF95|nr:hypothetical protein [Hymenobacter pini]